MSLEHHGGLRCRNLLLAATATGTSFRNSGGAALSKPRRVWGDRGRPLRHAINRRTRRLEHKARPCRVLAEVGWELSRHLIGNGQQPHPFLTISTSEFLYIAKQEPLSTVGCAPVKCHQYRYLCFGHLMYLLSKEPARIAWLSSSWGPHGRRGPAPPLRGTAVKTPTAGWPSLDFS